MSDPAEVLATLQRNTPVSDGAMGFTDSWANVTQPLTGRLRNHRIVPAQFAEQGAGLLKQTEQFLIFDQPITLPIGRDVRNYRFLINGEYWSVRQVDIYQFTVQVDLELIV